MKFILNFILQQVVVKTEPDKEVTESALPTLPTDSVNPGCSTVECSSGSVEPETSSKMKPDISTHSDIKKETTTAMDDLFGDIFITKVEKAPSESDKVQAEIEAYRAEPSACLSQDPLA